MTGLTEYTKIATAHRMIKNEPGQYVQQTPFQTATCAPALRKTDKVDRSDWESENGRKRLPRLISLELKPLDSFEAPGPISEILRSSRRRANASTVDVSSRVEETGAASSGE